MTSHKQRAAASRNLKKLWQNPEYRKRRTEAASRRMKANWANPDFVDRHLQTAVRNWSKPAYRQRQYAAILRGQRPLPLAKQPAGAACREAECNRLGAHKFHIAIEGSLTDGTLSLRGWMGRESPQPATAAPSSTLSRSEGLATSA